MSRYCVIFNAIKRLNNLESRRSPLISQQTSHYPLHLPVMAATARNAAKSADHTLYHLAPQGFWKKFREYIIYSGSTSRAYPSLQVM